MRQKTVEKLLSERLVVIIRVTDPDDIPAIVTCLIDGGVEAIEITSNTPGCMQAISGLRKDYPQLLIGAGTILSPLLAEEAIDAGAQFLVTPNTLPDVVAYAHEHDVPVIMGAMTPSEVVVAIESKADIVKLFPAGALGPEFLKALAGGPFLDTDFFAVGGVDEHNLEQWMSGGAAGVGIGGSLAAPVKTKEEAEHLTNRIKLIVGLLQSPAWLQAEK